MDLQSFSLNICQGETLQWDVYLDFTHNKVSYRKSDSREGTVNNNPKENNLLDNEIKSFLNELDQINILFWENNYTKIAKESEEWRLVMQFSDGTRVEFNGSNDWPENWKDFCLVVNSIIEEEDFLV